MPLVILPMSPGVELNLGNSLIPVTGIVLLLRSVLEGDYWQALQYSPIVAAVTLAACLMAIRWAVEQFNSEAVLFRESERLDLGLWLRRLLRDRRPTPTALGRRVLRRADPHGPVLREFFAVDAGRSRRACRAWSWFRNCWSSLPPVLLMTLLFTSSPRQTLLLKRPPWLAVPAAALLAVVLHPVGQPAARSSCSSFTRSARDVLPALEKMQELFRGADFWTLVLVIAVVPAVCEELAFRGFILSGFRHLGHKWRAIVYSALLFGLTHGILQQSLIASLVGVVLGYLAVQSGSILPVHGVSRVPQRPGDRQQPDHAGHASRLAAVAGVRRSRRRTADACSPGRRSSPERWRRSCCWRGSAGFRARSRRKSRWPKRSGAASSERFCRGPAWPFAMAGNRNGLTYANNSPRPIRVSRHRRSDSRRRS